MTAAKDKLCLVVCQNLVREVAAIFTAGGMHDVSVAAFPADCATPDIEWDILKRAGQTCPPGVQIHLVGDCGAANLSGAPEEGGKLYKIDPCPQLLIGKTLFEYYVNNRACLLIPGQLAQYKEAPTRCASMQGATSLVLLDTGVHQPCAADLETLASLTDVPAEILPIGLDHLRLFLTEVVLVWRLENEKSKSTAALSEAIRRSSDHAMALDLISSLTRIVTETEAIESILELFTLLFAPGRLVYVSWVGDRPGEAHAYPASLVETEPVEGWLARLHNDHTWTASGKGFLLRIGYQEETLGLLEIDDVAFPEHLEHYLNLALILGRVCGLTISNARAYEKSKQAEEQIRYQAYHDTLTDLPNRLLFNEHLTRALAEARHEQQCLAVLFIDLDNFKQVNDTLGHDTGDLLLQAVAERLQHSVRTGDTIARMGGDEFLLLLPRISQPGDAIWVARRIRENLAPVFFCSGHELQVTASIGIALYPQDGEDAETLLKRADTALYRVKEEGRDGCQFYAEKSVLLSSSEGDSQ